MIIYGLQTVMAFNDAFALKLTLTIYLFFNLCRLNRNLTFKVTIYNKLLVCIGIFEYTYEY